MSRNQIFREANETFDVVSKPGSITRAGTHVTKPNKSPKYSRKRILDTFDENVGSDVQDAKAGIELYRKKNTRK